MPFHTVFFLATSPTEHLIVTPSVNVPTCAVIVFARSPFRAQADITFARVLPIAVPAEHSPSAAIVHPPAVLLKPEARLSVHTLTLAPSVALLPRVLAAAAGDGPVAAIARNTAVVLLALGLGIADARVVLTALAGLAAVARHNVSAAVCILPAGKPHGRARGAVLCGHFVG